VDLLLPHKVRTNLALKAKETEQIVKVKTLKNDLMPKVRNALAFRTRGYVVYKQFDKWN
jgi:hypothetical protein